MKVRKSNARKKIAAPPEAAKVVAFEINPFYERLLEIKDHRPEAYRVMSPAARFAVEAYIKAKQSCAELKDCKTAA